MANSFSYGGTDMSTLGVFVAAGVAPWAPSPSIQAAGSPGGGYRLGGQGYRQGRAILPVVMRATSMANLNTYRDSIARTLDVTNGAKKLTIDSITDRYWIALWDSEIAAPNNYPGANTRFDLGFTLEGHAYGTTAVTGTSALATDPDDFTISAPAGNAPATTVWYIRNETGSTYTGNIRLDSSTMGEYIEWYGELGDDYWLRIGSEDANGRYEYSLGKSTTNGGTPSALTYTDARSGVTTNGGDWPRLKVAVTNTIQVTGLSAGTVNYSYRPRYIGG